MPTLPRSLSSGLKLHTWLLHHHLHSSTLPLLPMERHSIRSMRSRCQCHRSTCSSSSLLNLAARLLISRTSSHPWTDLHCRSFWGQCRRPLRYLRLLNSTRDLSKWVYSPIFRLYYNVLPHSNRLNKQDTNTVPYLHKPRTLTFRLRLRRIHHMVAIQVSPHKEATTVADHLHKATQRRRRSSSRMCRKCWHSSLGTNSE